MTSRRRRFWPAALVGVWSLTIGLSALATGDDRAAIRALELQTQEVIEAAQPSVVALLRTRQSAVHPVQGDFGDKPRANQPPFTEAVGTGIIIARNDDPAGRYILTTSHALLSALDQPADLASAHIEVRLFDQGAARATVIAADSRCGLAVLKLVADDRRTASMLSPPVSLDGPEVALKGAFVVALGNPAAIVRDGSPAASAGLISGQTDFIWNGTPPPGIDRDLSPPDLVPLWHVGTPLDGSHEGGAVLNLDGGLLALTTSQVTLEGQRSTSVFARPLTRFISSMLRGEEVELGFLGFEGRSASEGVELTRVAAGSPADEAGLQPGDVVARWDNDPLIEAFQLHRRIWLTPPGKEVTLSIRRRDSNGVQTRSISLTTIRWPVRESEVIYSTAPRRTWRGLVLDEATSRRRWLPAGLFGRLPTGALVTGLNANAPSHLKAGLIITAVNGHEVESVDDFLEHAPRAGVTQLRLQNSDIVSVP